MKSVVKSVNSNTTPDEFLLMNKGLWDSYSMNFRDFRRFAAPRFARSEPLKTERENDLFSPVELRNLVTSETSMSDIWRFSGGPVRDRDQTQGVPSPQSCCNH